MPLKTLIMLMLVNLCLGLTGCQSRKPTKAERNAAKTWSELRRAMLLRDERAMGRLMTESGRKAILGSSTPWEELDILAEFAEGFGESNVKWKELSPQEVHGSLPPWDPTIVFVKSEGTWKLDDFVRGE